MKNIFLLSVFTFCSYLLPAQICVFDEPDFGKGEEYTALKAIYNANPGNTLNWDLSDCDVCNWTGVTCVSGRVFRLSIPGKNISVLPSEISGLTEMEILNLFNNQLSDLPAEMGSLTRLNDLSLNSNHFSALPPVIGSLSGLASLGLHSNQLSTLPAEIGNLSNLTFLALYSNQFSTLPAVIWNLSSLTNLYLFDNQLTSLPSDIGNLSNLRSLLLQDNQLSALPAEVGNLSGLVALNLTNNQLSCLPAELASLCSNANITVWLSGNPFPYTWEEFCTEGLGTCCSNPDYEALAAIYAANYSNPESLFKGYLDWDLSDCHVCNWNGVICDENGRVAKLNLNGTYQSVLPPEIGDLSELTELSAFGMGLTSLPPEIGNLTKLERLFLTQNQLSSLPPEIGDLSELIELRIGSNQLTSLLPEIGNLTKLEQLILGYNQLSSLPPEVGDLSSLTLLNLSNNQLKSLPSELGNLVALTKMAANHNQLSDLPSTIGNLAKLDWLFLGNNQLNNLPPEMGQLMNLTQLLLNNNDLSCLPKEMSNLYNNTGFFIDLSGNPFPYSWEQFCTIGLGTCCDNPEYDILTSIYQANPGNTLNWNFSDCDVCSWEGVSCNGFGEVTILELPSKNLTSLPPEIGQLSSLRSLLLYDNQLSSLPPEVGQLSNLSILSLYDNQLASLPPEIGQLSSLYSLIVSGNQLSSLPSEIGQLSSLNILFLHNNQLSSLPPEIGQLSSLKNIVLQNNQLSSLPPEIGQLAGLTNLSLFSNKLSSLPPEVGQLTNLTQLLLSDNDLSCLPAEMRNLCSNTGLNITIAGNPFPYTWEQFCSVGLGTCCDNPEYDVLTAIYLANPGNTLSWDFSDCDVCSWEGVTCNASGQVYNLQLPSKNLSSLPPEIGQLSSLRILALQNNQLSSLPPEIGQLFNLQTILLSNNQLSGSLPVELGNLTNLQTLLLYNNQLSGSLPVELGNLTNLQRLEIYYNQLSGGLPVELGNLTNLQTLNLSNNQLDGSLPVELGNLTNLQTLILSNNQLSGSLPVELGNLTNLQRLILANNQLSGSLPAEIGQLSNLNNLVVSGNQLSSLPPEIGQLINLSQLFLSNNDLSCLPEEMTNLCNNTSLIVGLSGNPFPFDWDRFCSEGLGRCCDFPEEVSCSGQVNVLLDENGTYELTPQVVTDFNTTVDPCVYDLLQVSPSTLTCEDVSSPRTIYQLLYRPGDGTETSLCYGYVNIDDKTAPWFTSCPNSQYINLEPNTELTLTPADIGVSAADNCSVSLTTDPDPFIVTSADNGRTLNVTVIATDDANLTASCTVAVTVSVSNCSSGADAPENLVAAVLGLDVILSWDPVDEATDYNTTLEVYEIRKGKGKWKVINGLPPTVQGTSLAIPLADLDAMALYRFTVSVSGGGINCESVLEFTPNELANSDFKSLPSPRLEQRITPSLRVFPNPVRDRLHITFGQALDQAQRIRLIDLHGRSLREVATGPGESMVQIDVNGLPAGMYVVQVSDGTVKQLVKVVITP